MGPLGERAPLPLGRKPPAIMRQLAKRHDASERMLAKVRYKLRERYDTTKPPADAVSQSIPLNAYPSVAKTSR